jgi:hypothetical protein
MEFSAVHGERRPYLASCDTLWEAEPKIPHGCRLNLRVGFSFRNSPADSRVRYITGLKSATPSLPAPPCQYYLKGRGPTIALMVARQRPVQYPALSCRSGRYLLRSVPPISAAAEAAGPSTCLANPCHEPYGKDLARKSSYRSASREVCRPTRRCRSSSPACLWG